jgi:hypothetical protein
VPEWQATLDALQKLPEIGTEAPIGYGGGITLGTAIGIPLTATEPGRPSHHPLGRGRPRVPGPPSRPGRHVTGLT